jgi:hypothetical protein
MNASVTSLVGAGIVVLFLAAEPGVDQGRFQGDPGVPLLGAPASGARLAASEAATLNEVVEEYCVRCHSDRRLTGNMSLEGFDVGQPEASPELAERLVHKLRAGMMPPAGSRRPAADTLDLLVTALEDRLDAVARETPNPGRRSFQRLNRADYEATVREMFGLEIDASAYLPTETLSDNFDNIADTQILSATLLEGYMRAAAQVARDAVGDASATPATTVYKIPKTVSQVEHIEGTPVGTRGGTAVTHNFPADGDYVFVLELHASPDGQLFGLTKRGERIEVSVNGERVALLDIDRFMSEADPTGLKLETPRIHVRAGPQTVAAAFLRESEGPNTDLIQPIDFTLADPNMGVGYGVTTLPHLRDLAITGPFRVTGVSETPSRQRIFTCRPTASSEEVGCAREIVARLAQQAFRRPLENGELDELMVFYEDGRAEGGFEVGVRNALWAILASPRFVFRLEETPRDVQPGQPYQVDDHALASRLSFFLWAAPPDAELLQLADEGRLAAPGELERQARRMLADPRAETLSTRFASQWLRLQDLDKVNPDAQLYPYFDQQLKQAMRRETESLFRYLVEENGSALDLLTADYTFVNERLAEHYGIEGVVGTTFRRVAVEDPNRRGLLGHGSMLMMTSHANRTSPVMRGKWVMEVLLGSPPPPPPPVGVPPFDQTAAADGARQLTTRERMEMHRANPACNSCHSVIDPIGLALDNFDVTGAWRIKENLTPIDARGELYDGSQIDGPAGLRGAIMRRPSVFVRTFARNLMAYALGRRIEYYDMPTIREIERAAAQDDYRMSNFILGVVNSPAFRMSLAPETTEANASGDRR